MNLIITSRTCHTRSKSRAGFSLLEMLISVAIGVVVVTGVAVTWVFTEANYCQITNYTSMANQGRNALDVISKTIRNSSALVSFSTNNPISLTLTNATLGTLCQIYYDTNSSVVIITNNTTGATTNLTGCDSWSFSLYSRAPNTSAFTNDVVFYPSTNYLTGQLDPNFCKLINLSWKCSRTLFGNKINTEDVQTAQVVMRNQVAN